MLEKRCSPLVLLVWMSTAGLGAQTAQHSMQSAAAIYSEWIGVMAEITRGVELEERDIRNFLDHWAALQELEVADMEEEDPAKFRQSFDRALADPRYRSWATARGLDPDGFVRSSMRISSLFMLQQAAAQEAMASQQWSEHAAMVEEQCAKVDAETCRQMREGLAASKALGQSMAEARKKLPAASARERALMERYGAEIEATMVEDTESDDFDQGYDEDYYEDYDDDYDEDYDGR